MMHNEEKEMSFQDELRETYVKLKPKDRKQVLEAVVFCAVWVTELVVALEKMEEKLRGKKRRVRRK